MRGDGITQRNTVHALFVINSTVEQSNSIGDMSAAIAPRKPMELMQPTASMIDRRKESRTLIASALNPRGCGCVLVTGLSGIGKTTLVRTWARRFSRLFPAGVINVDFAAGRKGGAVPVAGLQRGTVNSLYGVERFSDADDSAWVREWHLKTLSPQDSRRLLSKAYSNYTPSNSGGARKLDLTGDDAKVVLDYCGGIPGVLAHCASLLAEGSHTVESLAATIRGFGRIPESDEQRYTGLWREMVRTMPSDGARKRFYLLGILPSEKCPEALLGFLWGIETDAELRQALVEMRRFDLEYTAGDGTFRMSAALHRFAHDEALAHLSGDDLSSGYAGVVRYCWFLHEQLTLE